MRFSFFFLLNFLFLTSVYSQTTKKNDFSGILKSSNNDIITYKINFKEIGDGKIEGESITDFNGENSTKSKIKGTINLKENKLSFHEVSNISTKSTADENQFCYVHVENLKINTSKGQSIIQGKFKGLYSTGKKCGDGTIYLVGAEILERIEKKMNVDSTKLNDSLNVLLQQYSNSTKKSTKILSNDNFKTNWKSDKIVLEVWDDNIVDNDIITIICNGETIVENFEITKEKKNIEISFKENRTTVTIKAVNDGASPPNTVNIMLKDGGNTTPLISILQKGEIVFIEFDKIK